VKTTEIPPPRDPEFDHPPRPAPRGPGRDVVGYYQRLLVNPFLALGFLAGTLAFSVYWSRPANVGRYPWLLGVYAGLLASYFALRYHCLDCGESGTYHRWRRHACAKVVERWNTPFASASHLFPTPTTQIALWLLGLAFAAYLTWAVVR
jgi:hypothetical protein